MRQKKARGEEHTRSDKRICNKRRRDETRETRGEKSNQEETSADKRRQEQTTADKSRQGTSEEASETGGGKRPQDPTSGYDSGRDEMSSKQQAVPKPVPVHPARATLLGTNLLLVHFMHGSTQGKANGDQRRQEGTRGDKRRRQDKRRQEDAIGADRTRGDKMR